MDSGIWKIHQTGTALFSTGGNRDYSSRREWTKTGKTWSSLGKLMQHVMANEEYYRNIASRIEIVKLKVEVEKSVDMMMEIASTLARKITNVDKKRQAKIRGKLKSLDREKRKLEQQLA